MVTDQATIATWDLLKEFGFQADEKVISDITPGLSFDFGLFKLSASCVTNMSFSEIILFTGVVATQRTLAEVMFELPRIVKSREQCAAWIVWNLDRHSKGQVFEPIFHIGW